MNVTVTNIYLLDRLELTVQAVVEQALGSWDPSTGWHGFMHYTIATHELIHCLYQSVSGRSQLSPTQADHMLKWGQKGLSQVHAWLHNLQWQGLHLGCLNAQATEQTCVLTFPHLASDHFIVDIIDPLLMLCSIPAGSHLVSSELASALEHAWHTAQSVYPDAFGADEGAPFIWCSGLDHILPKLEKLRAAVKG